jgi:hypothetical protein
MKITNSGWSTDVERLVKAMVLPGRRPNFGVDEVTALDRAELLGVLYDWCEELRVAVAAGLAGWHAAPGHGGSANRHPDVRGSEPQVGYSQEGAPD